MAASTIDRDSPALLLDVALNYLQKGGTIVYDGCIAMTDASGYLVPGADTVNCKVAGRANARGDTTASGPNGVLADGVGNLDVRLGIFQFDNPTGANQLTLADMGKLAYVLTDHELIRAAGTTNSIIAGRVVGVDLVLNKVTVDMRVRAV